MTHPRLVRAIPPGTLTGVHWLARSGNAVSPSRVVACVGAAVGLVPKA